MKPDDDKLSWFHGKLSRSDADNALMTAEDRCDGLFLVRESNSANGDFVLSVLHEETVCHYQIRRFGEDAFFSIDDENKIHGLDSLIEFYQSDSNGLVTKLNGFVKNKLPPNDSRSHGRTNLLHRATKAGQYTVVDELLKSPYRNIDAKNQEGQTAVHLACNLPDDKILQRLIDSKANVNCRDTDGNTPLHYVCRNQSAESVRLLIDKGANVQARNNESGYVPLHDAAKSGNLEAVKQLLAMNAAVMPRTVSGELPIDFAKENGHTEIINYLNSYKTPPANTHKDQWYHGTLQRDDAIILLKEHANKLAANCSKDEQNQNLDNEDRELNIKSNEAVCYSSGVYLVRYSHRNNGSYVLTLLADNLPRHFQIQKSQQYLYIDDGPYMPSLEHLVQHFSLFSDGLPVNLKYPVKPEPKPPIPLFSTIPKTKTVKSPVIESPPSQPMKTNTSSISPMSSKNLEMSVSPKEKTNDLLNFRSLKLKSPKKNIIMDGMKSLRKPKTKNLSKKEEMKRKSIQHHIDVAEAQKMMKEITFSADFPPVSPVNDSVYNTPRNNSICNTSLDETLYFTESDQVLVGPSMEKEETYFIDHPTVLEVKPNDNAFINTNVTFNGAGYVESKSIPMFFDHPNHSQIIERNFKTTQRLDSILSNYSELSESDFPPVFQNQNSINEKPNYFIPFENLDLQETLGEGEFGSVYKGVLRILVNGNGEEQLVAIKTLHDERCKENRIGFLKEASVMIRLRHHCIVRLIGISKGPPLMMVQELVALGSMLDYIIENQEKINPNFELKIWASQIACGMNYLESQHFVHRDLAARNILLSSRNQAKISDFGLSRVLGTGNDYYQATQGGKWPIKWYAPESYLYGNFSHASDVWSFGVTLWEMFSFGEPPYGEKKGVEVIQLIEDGERLSQPGACPDNIFNIIKTCWNHNPKTRPTFTVLTDFFANDPDYQNITELIRTDDIS